MKYKNSKKYKLNTQYLEVEFKCDVVDKSRFKSINYDIDFWYDNHSEYAKSEVNQHYKNIKRYVGKNLDTKIFFDRFIGIQNTPIQTKINRDFFNRYEFVFFFNSDPLLFQPTEYFNNLSHKIQKEFFADNPKFKGKKIKIKQIIEQHKI